MVDHDRDPCRASSGEHLNRLLAEHKSHVFSLIQKFNQDVDPNEGYTLRDDLIVITDEAHRTQYGTLALNMRNAPKMPVTSVSLARQGGDTRCCAGEHSRYPLERQNGVACGELH